MIDRLFVLWRDHHDRTRHVVGQLWRASGSYRFAYVKDLSDAQRLGFEFLAQFPEHRTEDRPYSSGYLFSTFLQRVPNPARSDFKRALEEIGVETGDDPLEVLAKSGGALVTDSIELAEYRSPDDGLLVPLTFRLAGVKFLPDPSAKLKEGDAVELCREPDNAHDANATVVLKLDGRKAGYVPRYYAGMIARVLDAGFLVRGKAERQIPMPEDTRWVIKVWRGGEGHAEPSAQGSSAR